MNDENYKYFIFEAYHTLIIYLGVISFIVFILKIIYLFKGVC